MEDVKFVINFDYPNNSEDYVHRIGRTGRSNNTGTAYTLFTYQNASKASDLVAVLKEANQVVNPKLYDLGKSNSHGSNRNSRYGNRSGGGGSGGGNPGVNAFRTNRPFGNNNLNGNRSNGFGNGTENAFRRDRPENGAGSRFSDGPSRFSNADGASRYPSSSMNGSTGTSRFSNNLNSSNATASSNNSTNSSNLRYGNSNDMRYGGNDGTSGGVGGLRGEGGSRFSAPNPPSATSRFSNNDAYPSKSATASSGNDFYQNASSNKYGENKAKLPTTNSSTNGTAGGMPYPPPYTAAHMFSYPPPTIH